MKADLLLALKNQHDSRRYGLLLPIREWLPGLNEENLLGLLGKISFNLFKFSHRYFQIQQVQLN